MSDNQQPQTNEVALPFNTDGLVQAIQTVLPKLEKIRDKVVAGTASRLEEIRNFNETYDGSPSDEAAELLDLANGTIVAAGKAYDVMKTDRVSITEKTDRIKSFLMDFERVANNDGKEKNNVTDIRNEIAAIKNKQLKYKENLEKEAQVKKEKENYKVDLVTKIRKNLASMLVDLVKKVDEYSADLWNKTTLETFESNKEKYMKWAPKLKDETYVNAFKVDFDKNKINKEEFDELVVNLQQEETAAKWSANLTESTTPIINKYRAKIDSVKEELIKIRDAKDEEAKKKLLEEKAEQEKKEREETAAQLNKVQAETEKAIDDQAEGEKMGNEFAAQVVTQGIETGPTKKVYVLKDPTKVLKGLQYAIAASMSHEKFDGIYKKDKAGAIVTDKETGKPQLIDPINWWLKFCAQYAQVNLEGFELKDVAKVIARG